MAENEKAKAIKEKEIKEKETLKEKVETEEVMDVDSGEILHFRTLYEHHFCFTALLTFGIGR